MLFELDLTDGDVPRMSAVEQRRAGASAREVVHDLRQPIATVAALVGATELNTELPADVRSHLEQIKVELRVMAQLCRRLLDDVPTRVPALRLDLLAREAVTSASLAFDRPIEVQTTPVEVAGDELALRRAVQNLLENACRAAGRQGTVRIIVRHSGGGRVVRLEVHDDGPGFGCGAAGFASLGLRIVQAVAADHGGRLEVGKSDLGGASLVLVLPLSPVELEGSAAQTMEMA